MDFTSIVKTVAPWIGTAIGGPLGGLAVEAATKALGISDKTTEGLKAALAGVSAEDMLKLKAADQAFQAHMTELGFKNLVDLESIAANDRASARDMQKSIRSWVPSALSIIVTVGFFGLLIGMLQGWLKLTDSQALLLMLGSLTTGWGVVMQYWFGSTSNSQIKTDIISRSQPVGK
jgi:hypothetical protein